MKAVRLDRMIGRRVMTANSRPLGRLEECRVDPETWTITEWLVGSAGLLDRLGLGARLIFGISHRSGYVIRWDQLDVTNPTRPRLTCPVDELSTRT